MARHAGDGDTRHFEQLVKRHQARVVANCRYLTRSPGDAEDLAQEVFVKVFFALRRFEGRSRFASWLQRIKINHCLNYLRKRSGRTFVDLDDPELRDASPLHIDPLAERRVVASDARAQIAAVLDALSDTLRIPLIMRDADGLSYEEIADGLGIGLSAVKMRIKRAREEFRRLYDQPAPSAAARPGSHSDDD